MLLSSSMTKTIVTGANGFIGKYLCRKLNGVETLSHSEIIRGHSYNAEKMFFLSTYGNMAHHGYNQMIVQANVEDLLTVINGGFSGWLCYMSSSSVALPVQTSYSRSKRAAEEILQALPELDSCIVRPYSVTGVGEQKEHLIPTLIRSCMEGEEMQFDPDPVHDFVDVEDVVEVLYSLSDRHATGIVEIGSGIPHSNQEVRELVEHFCQKKANIKGECRMRIYDNDYWCCRSMKWKLKKTLADSIEEMVEAYKNDSGSH